MPTPASDSTRPSDTSAESRGIRHHRDHMRGLAVAAWRGNGRCAAHGVGAKTTDTRYDKYDPGHRRGPFVATYDVAFRLRHE
jgi:hypothetical protein